MESIRENVSAAATGGKRGTLPLLFVTGCALLGLCGCPARQMKVDYKDFESAYAETSNREVLLNLARLENHDPTYFFKLGQISTSYRMQAALSGNGNYVTQGTGSGTNVTGGGTSSLLYERDPAFTFIPVNDDTNAQFLLKPIPSVTFYTLYEQGWRLDQLFRLMVDRIELTTSGKDPIGGENVCMTETIRNVPPVLDPTTGAARNPNDLTNYVRFLRVSAILYVLQKRGYLLLRGKNTFVPLDENSFLPSEDDKTDGSAHPSDPPAKNGARDPDDPDGGGGTGNKATITASDFNSAWAKNSVWRRVPANKPCTYEKTDSNASSKDEPSAGWKWCLGQEEFSPIFLLNPPFIACDKPTKAPQFQAMTSPVRIRRESRASLNMIRIRSCAIWLKNLITFPICCRWCLAASPKVFRLRRRVTPPLNFRARQPTYLNLQG